MKILEQKHGAERYTGLQPGSPHRAEMVAWKRGESSGDAVGANKAQVLDSRVRLTVPLGSLERLFSAAYQPLGPKSHLQLRKCQRNCGKLCQAGGLPTGMLVVNANLLAR